MLALAGRGRARGRRGPASRQRAGRYERSETRTNQRYGSVPRRWDTPVGTMELAIPKVRQGSFFPTLLEQRRCVDQTLVNVVVESYANGVSEAN